MARLRLVFCSVVMALVLLTAACAGLAGTVTVKGYILDPNWYAPHPYMTSPQVYGTGVYEYGVAGNTEAAGALGFFSNTENYAENFWRGIYGYFSRSAQPDGIYTISTWDNWWRPAFAFDQNLVGTGAPNVMLRLHANVWSYAPNWDSNWYNEFGQLFEATGTSVTMVVLRSASSGTGVTVRLLEGGPNGPQVGASRRGSLNSGPTDLRLVWNGGEAPTIPGNIYYLQIKCDGTSKGAICNNDPIPDMSDISPAGGLYHDGILADPDMDLGVTICSDDDGVLTNMFTRPGGTNIYGGSVGQTFTARGTSLISFCAWIATDGTYTATLYDRPGGTRLGVAKRSGKMRWSDPEVLWTWAPGACPLTPGNTYYLEVTRDGGGSFTAYGTPWGYYAGGRAYANGSPTADANQDMAGAIMEEESPNSATRKTVQFSAFPAVTAADRGTNSLTIRWTTDVPSDSTVQYAAWSCPYTNTYYNSALTTSHAATITGLEPNTMYHLRVKGAASGLRTGVTRDFVVCTINSTPNLLRNPGFEEGSGSSPRTIPSPPWFYSGMDTKASSGNWFGGVPPYAEDWLCEAAVSGTTGAGVLYQRVPAIPGLQYNFTAALSSWMQENDRWKYDVWHNSTRIPYVKIGIDPYGGTDPNSPNVRWSKQFYSHLHYTTVGTRAVAASSNVTVFVTYISKGGQSGTYPYWNIFGVDDCRLSAVYPAPTALSTVKTDTADNTGVQVADLIITASPAEAGAYYAETSDRSHGIRIESTDSAAVGQRVTVAGTVYTDPQTHERSLKNAVFMSTVGDTEPEPLMMQCRSIGGAELGTLIPAVPGSTGPHNTALAVKVAGKVTAKDPGGAFVFVNDGSIVAGGVPTDGIKVDTSRVPLARVPNAGDVAEFSGISSLYESGGVKPIVIVRRESDVVNVTNP